MIAAHPKAICTLRHNGFLLALLRFMLAAGLFLLIAAPRDVLAASGGVALTIIGVAASAFQAILMYLENEQGKATKQGKASATKHPLLIVPPLATEKCSSDSTILKMGHA